MIPGSGRWSTPPTSRNPASTSPPNACTADMPGMVRGSQWPAGTVNRMEFRRINALPPYVFAAIDARKLDARRAGEDVIDLGFGNPDLPSPEIAVEKMAEAGRHGRNHRGTARRAPP